MAAPFTTSVRNVRHAIKSWTPNWLSDRPSLRAGFSVLFTIALIADCLIEATLGGLRAAWPGVGDPSALDLVGQSRGLIRGITANPAVNESDASFAARLRAWLDTWTNAGSDAVLATEIQAYLGGNLVVRVVNRAGHFVTVNADQSITLAADTNWNWDTVDMPERLLWWSDVWIIVYVTDSRWPVYPSFSDATWLANWGRYDTAVGGIGHTVPRPPVSGISSIVATWKGAHTWLEAIIWTNDTTLFVPGSLGGVPPGTWGNWSHDVSNQQVPARLEGNNGTQAGTTYVRYWIPNQGG